MAPQGPEELTQRERDVLPLLRKGLTNRQIADSLYIDVRTAEFHVANIKAKLGVKRRAEVAAYVTPSSGTGVAEGRPMLPASLTSFVGREAELEALQSLLQRSRLVSLTGPGGIGKSRLALEAARLLQGSYLDGVWLVDLAQLRDNDHVAGAFLTTLGLRDDGNRSRIDGLVSALRQRDVLLLVDNCEHLLDGVAALLQHVVTACQRTHVLATSRVPLGISGEVLMVLEGLPTPPTADGSSGFDAPSVRLFIDRAQLARPEYEPTYRDLQGIAGICRALDGMPLAIELAAARMLGMAPSEILSRIRMDQSLLRTSSKVTDERHKAMTVAVDWSYKLLDEPARRAFERLSICAGFDLATAEVVCASPPVERRAVGALVQQLVENSMVLAKHSAQRTAFRILEPLRQYGFDRLVSTGEAEKIQRIHAQHFLEMMEQAFPDVTERPRPDYVETVEAHLDNLRIALAWSAQHDAGIEGRLVDVMFGFWNIRGLVGETLDGVKHALPRTKGASKTRAHLLHHLVNALYIKGNPEPGVAMASAQEELAIAEQLGSAREQAWAMQTMAQACTFVAEEQVGHWLRMAADLARTVGDPWLLAYMLSNFGMWLALVGNYEQARTVLDEALGLISSTGDLWGEEGILEGKGVVAFEIGDDNGAYRCWSEAVRIGSTIGDRYQLNQALDGLSQIAIKQGQYLRGLCLGGAAEGIRVSMGGSSLVCDHPHLADWQARARQALSIEAADQAWLEGRRMTYERAVEYALEGSEADKAAAIANR